MNIEITEAHKEIEESFKYEFEFDYGFKVHLIVDEDIPDYNGSQYQKVAIEISDPQIKESIQIMLDENNNTHYNVYEDTIEEIGDPSELWKYLYFNLAQKIRNT